MNTFIINKQRIINNYNTFKQIGPIYYPIKANSNKAVIDILSNIFDDKDKFAISNKNIIDSNKTTLINPFYNLEELEYFYNEGVRDFVFEDLDIFIKFKTRHSDIISSVRINLNEIIENNNTFIGAPLKETLQMIAEGCSLSIYCPTEFRKDDYLEDCLSAAKIFGTKTLRLSGFNITDIKKILTFKNDTYIDLITEPGESLINNAIDYECDIIKFKKINNNYFLILNTSIYKGLFDYLLYDKKYSITCNDKILNYNGFGTPCTLCGVSGDSKDIFGTVYLTNEDIKTIENAKNVTFKNVGAYFENIMTNYGKETEYEVKIVESLQ